MAGRSTRAFGWGIGINVISVAKAERDPRAGVGGPRVDGGNEAAFCPHEIFVARKGTQAEKFLKGWMGLDGIVNINHSLSFREFIFDEGWPVNPK
jgi:hypothetical protein